MGKASKRMKRKQEKKQQRDIKSQNNAVEIQFIQEYQEGRYDMALESLAKLIEGNDIKPELLYYGACCYYGLMDYERAAQWVSNTLNYAPGHIAARILLAKVCIAQYHYDDAMAILDLVMSCAGISAEERAEVELLVRRSFRGAEQKIREQYPHLASLLENDAIGEDKIKKHSDVLSTLQNLKERVKKIEKEDERIEPVAKAKSITECKETVDVKIKEILAKDISIREKMHLFNMFASASYMQNDYMTARTFLKAALEQDVNDEESLRNMAITIAAMGDKDKAEEIVAKMPRIDFLLLKEIKNM